MIDALRSLAKEFADLETSLQDPAVLSDHREVAKRGKRLAELRPLISLLSEYDNAEAAVKAVDDVRSDPELLALAEEEAREAKKKLPVLLDQMRAFLVPKDPDDDRNVIIEVRAGAGGDEAALFAAELFRMYLRYGEEHHWKTELLSKADADAGGIKEVVCRMQGLGAYGDLKFESGVHRVQRIPATENKGRVHTSTATVAILPEAEEVDIKIRLEDLRIDTFRASGAGGQHVNKTESAIRITHLPTNTVVECQTERSQLRNREVAMNLLRSRLYSAEQERLAKERGDLRSGQIGSGDRSEKIRTYNFPQDRITDHRLEENFSNIPAVMEGKLGPIVQALQEKSQADKLASIQAKI
jgi:peptide chain release factor 1